MHGGPDITNTEFHLGNSSRQTHRSKIVPYGFKGCCKLEMCRQRIVVAPVMSHVECQARRLSQMMSPVDWLSSIMYM